jgi:hypothetical protein
MTSRATPILNLGGQCPLAVSLTLKAPSVLTGTSSGFRELKNRRVWKLAATSVELASEHTTIEGDDKRLLYRALLNARFLHGCAAPFVKLMA